MRSARPKPLHLICGRPMVMHVIHALEAARPERTVVVVGHGAERVTKKVHEQAPDWANVNFVEQHVQRGTGDAAIHQLAWDAFVKGTEVAKQEGLYGAGQDLLKTSFSGNVKGMGPAVAEMEIDERPAEPFLFFAADKTDPGAFNLPLYLAFADPMNTPGLMLAPNMAQGFRFVIDHENRLRPVEALRCACRGGRKSS